MSSGEIYITKVGSEDGMSEYGDEREGEISLWQVIQVSTLQPIFFVA